MKRFFLLSVAFFLYSASVSAQVFTGDIANTANACYAMRTAIGSGSLPALAEASKALKQSNASPFVVLECLDESVLSLNGHFVFEPEFADSLIAGKKVYEFAQKYADRSRYRGGSKGTGRVFYSTCCVKAQSSAKFAFNSRMKQELAVITEPGGMVTLRVHDTRNDCWYNDIVDETQGRPYRYLSFELPPKELTRLEVEIINTCDKDISFVIISN